MSIDVSPHMPDNVESIHDAIHILFNKAYITPQPSTPEDVPIHLVDETLLLIKKITERDVIGDNDEAGRLSIPLTVHRNELRSTQRKALGNTIYGKDIIS